MRRRITLTSLAMTAIVVSSFPLFAAPPEHSTAESSFTTTLFDGGALDHWIVTGCEVAVENGSLVLTKGNGFVRSHQRYGDFVLELEWKVAAERELRLRRLFRADLPQGKRPWPTQHQINLKQGDEGNVKTLTGATSTGLVKPGEWNHFKLTVIGRTAALEINGRQAWKVDRVEPAAGYIGLQAEVPLGGQFEFRNIRVTELGYKSLFNGRDLTGWEGATQDASRCWKVQDGLLVCTGQRGTWLRSAEQYGDFNLRLAYRAQARRQLGRVSPRAQGRRSSRAGAIGRTQRHRSAVARRRRQALRVDEALPVGRQLVRAGRGQSARRPSRGAVEHAGNQLPRHVVSRDAQRRRRDRRHGQGIAGARPARVARILGVAESQRRR